MNKDEKDVTSAPVGYPEIYEHIWSLVNDVLRENAVESSGSIAFEISEEFRRQFGGQQLYFARDAHDELLKPITDFIISVLQKRESAGRNVSVIAEKVSRGLSEILYQVIYFPLSKDSDRLERNRKIYSEFSGRNIPELAYKYGLSSVQIRNILRKRPSLDR